MTENKPSRDVERETGGRQAGRQDGGTGQRQEQSRTPGTEPHRKGEKELQEVE